jgi:hypothetical protein
MRMEGLRYFFLAGFSPLFNIVVANLLLRHANQFNLTGGYSIQLFPLVVLVAA